MRVRLQHCRIAGRHLRPDRPLRRLLPRPLHVVFVCNTERHSRSFFLRSWAFSGHVAASSRGERIRRAGDVMATVRTSDDPIELQLLKAFCAQFYRYVATADVMGLSSSSHLRLSISLFDVHREVDEALLVCWRPAVRMPHAGTVVSFRSSIFQFARFYNARVRFFCICRFHGLHGR